MDPLICEICSAIVDDAGAHYVATPKGSHQDGYWRCHPHVGKWRCAKQRCGHIWKPRRLVAGKLPRCPQCGEGLDVFPADDGIWESNKRERDRQRQQRED